MRNEIKAVVRRLQKIAVNIKIYQLTAEAKDDEERADKLSEELDSIAAAIEALEEIE